MPRVLIVSYPWLPAFNGAVKHAALLARHLPDAGWDPIILAADWIPEEFARDTDLHVECPATTDDVPSLRAAAVLSTVRVPFAPLDNRWLRWRQSHEDTRARDQRWGARGLARRALAATEPLHGEYPDEFRGWVAPATSAGVAAVRQFGVGAVISLSAPDSAHVAAGEIARAAGVPWVPIFRQLGAFEVGRGDGRRPAHRMQHHVLARGWLRGAARAFAARPEVAAHLQRRYGLTTDTLPIPLDPEERRMPPRRAAGAPLRLVHVGRLSAAHRAVGVLLDALDALLRDDASLAARVEVEFVGTAHEEQWTDRLRGRVAANVCRLVPRTSPADAVVRQREADAVLLFVDGERGAAAVAQLPERLNARRPVVAVGGDDRFVQEAVTELRAGVVLESAPELARWLRDAIATVDREGELPYSGDEQGIARHGAPEIARRIGATLDVASAERFGRWQRG